MKTWQEKAKKLIRIKNDSYADSSGISGLIKSLKLVDTSNISKEERELLNQATS